MDAQVDRPSTVALTQIKALVPGYLLTPFGWAANPLAAMIQSDPGLLKHMFELDRPRMHVIALALAQLDDNPAQRLAPVLFRGSAREVLQRVVGQAHVGFKGVLRRLPSAVLSRQGYLRLIELLDDPLCTKALHHLEQREITDSIVSILYEAPAELRSVLAELLRVIENTEKLDHLQDGLRWLARRGAAESFDALVTDLAAHVQPGQFVARLRILVSELPLPQTLPPKRSGTHDGSTQQRILARWLSGSRIASQLFRHGSMLVYARYTCGTIRLNLHGRLGWCLSETLGPSNAELDENNSRKSPPHLPKLRFRTIPPFAPSNAFCRRTAQQGLVRRDSDSIIWNSGYWRSKTQVGSKMSWMRSLEMRVRCASRCAVQRHV